MEAFVGTILPVGFNYAPSGWMMCQGQLLPISQYSALFSLLGTTYGGNGTTNFALPDLRGRTLVGAGQGPGLSPVIQGEIFGTQSATVSVTGSAAVTIDAAHLPKHTHPVSIPSSQLSATSTLYATSAGPGLTAPGDGAALGNTGSGPASAAIYVSNGAAPNVALNNASVKTTIPDVNATSGENAGGSGTIAAPVNATGQVSVAPPSLGINYVICLNGIYPSRN
jgi:microcystin-dependent protein